jgi:hypothetical protein
MSLYVSIKSSRFCVALNGETIVARCNTMAEAKQEARRRNSLAVAGLLPAGVYEAQSLTQRPESRPFNWEASGNGGNAAYLRRLEEACRS